MEFAPLGHPAAGSILRGRNEAGPGDLRSAVSAGSETRAEQELARETYGRRFRRGQRPAPSKRAVSAESETRAEQVCRHDRAGPCFGGWLLVVPGAVTRAPLPASKGLDKVPAYRNRSAEAPGF
jgi:hypothetical protein